MVNCVKCLGIEHLTEEEIEGLPDVGCPSCFRKSVEEKLKNDEKLPTSYPVRSQTSLNVETGPEMTVKFSVGNWGTRHQSGIDTRPLLILSFNLREVCTGGNVSKMLHLNLQPNFLENMDDVCMFKMN
jgi:hypothetical protein